MEDLNKELLHLIEEETIVEMSLAERVREKTRELLEQ